jgi:hypothetical protein
MRGSCFRRSRFARGNTITAFGSQEWLMRATRGDTVIPSGVKEGEVRVKVFVMN